MAPPEFFFKLVQKIKMVYKAYGGKKTFETPKYVRFSQNTWSSDGYILECDSNQVAWRGQMVQWSNGPMVQALVLLALSVIHTDEYFKLPVIIIINVSKQHSHLHHDDPEHLVAFDVAQVLTRAHNLPSEGKIVARLASGPPRGCS